MKRCFIKGPFWLPVTILLLLCFSVRTQAKLYLVTDTNDTTKVTSLRGAVIAANQTAGNNTIVLGYEKMRRGLRIHQLSQPWVYQLTIPGAGEEAALTGDLNVTRGNLTILGVGNNVTIDATGLGDRVFHVSPGARLTLQNLTVSGGIGSANGGAAWNAGELRVDRCCITNNSSGGDSGPFFTTAGLGGGIYNTGTLTLMYCVVAGNATGTGFGGDGGGVFNAGTAVLKGCIITANAGANGLDGEYHGIGGNGGNGGGIYNSGGMVLCDCLVNNNRSGEGGLGRLPDWSFGGPGDPGGAGGGGAGIFNVGEMRLKSCTVDGNAAGKGGDGGSPGTGGDGGPGGGGAGILNLGTLSLETCTVSGNRCGTGGNGAGGWGFSGGSGAAGGVGGGILSTGPLDMNSCTIVLNEAGAGGNGGNGDPSGNVPGTAGGAGGSGGGVLAGSNSAVSLRNTLVALNSAGAGGLGGTNTAWPLLTEPSVTIGDPRPDGSGPDVAGGFDSQGYNLIGMADGSTGLTNRFKADQAGSIASPIDPLIGPLQMNGGPAPTHALLPGSPAIDQGKCFGVRLDQRGQRRPYDYRSLTNATGGDGSDIGAFELRPAPTRSQ